jgi:hypothetical protein
MKGVEIMIFLFFLSGYLISCCNSKELAYGRLPDGTYMAVSRPADCKKHRDNLYLVGVRGLYPHLHHEYFINRFTCDTIVKKIFTRKIVTIMYLTSESNYDRPITEEDKKLFSMAIPFVDSTNTCYRDFINNAKGYKLYYEGKRKR